MANKMDMKEFEGKVTERVIEVFDDDKISLSVQDINKVTGDYRGLIIKTEESNISPTINLDAIYNTLDSIDDDDIQLVAENIIKTYRRSVGGFEADLVRDMLCYDKIRNRLFIRLSGSHIPSTDILPHIDIAEGIRAFAAVLVQSDERSFASATVTNDLLDVWEVGFDQVYKDALESGNAVLPSRVTSLGDVLGLPDEDIPMIIVTNKTGNNGAGSILYKSVQEELERILGKEFYIIPSSIDELICVPKISGSDTIGLVNMIRTVNDESVEPQKRLSYDLYEYNDGQIIKTVF